MTAREDEAMEIAEAVLRYPSPYDMPQDASIDVRGNESWFVSPRYAAHCLAQALQAATKQARKDALEEAAELCRRSSRWAADHHHYERMSIKILALASEEGGGE